MHLESRHPGLITVWLFLIRKRNCWKTKKANLRTKYPTWRDSDMNSSSCCKHTSPNARRECEMAPPSTSPALRWKNQTISVLTALSGNRNHSSHRKVHFRSADPARWPCRRVPALDIKEDTAIISCPTFPQDSS